MVLQQKSKAPVWGWARPGEKVRVRASWEQAGDATTADEHGKWKLDLSTPGAGGPYTISIEGNNSITLSDVLIGEVWLCSGQSNMAMALGRPQPGYNEPVLNHEAEIAGANFPQIRLFTVPLVASDTPLDHCDGNWQPCRPQSVAAFSALAYFFGRELHRELKVPVGLIHASWGGSALESWIDRPVLERDQEYAHILDRYDTALKNLPRSARKYQDDIEHWRRLPPAEQQQIDEPGPPFGVVKHCAPATLYNGMISPLLPFAIRGVIFYQGEENTVWSCNYHRLFSDLIWSWRAAWQRPELFFIYAQLSSFDVNHLDRVVQNWVNWHKGSDKAAGLTDESWARVQEAQFKTLAVPNTGMAVTIDIGSPNNVHPTNKQEVARRLSLWALAKIHDRDVVYSGPLYQSMRKEGGMIAIEFERLQSPLRAGPDGSLQGFFIAGNDRAFYPAEARIRGNEVVVRSPQVQDPAAVRYAWGSNPQHGLYNEQGLPASPFRTDDW
ncbi:MAG: sialate O-acetylesterase [Opitutaceae bacterium]|nr:sialate O-acetylesterase [Opitutaceae bacterium]